MSLGGRDDIYPAVSAYRTPTPAPVARNRYAEIMSQFGQSQPFSFFGYPEGYTGGFTPYQRTFNPNAAATAAALAAAAAQNIPNVPGSGNSRSGAEREGPSAFSQMTPAERAAYYAANPTEGSIALGAQDLLGNATLLGQIVKYFGADAFYDSRLEKLGLDPESFAYGPPDPNFSSQAAAAARQEAAQAAITAANADTGLVANPMAQDPAQRVQAADTAETQNLLNRYPALVAPPAPVVTAPIVEAPVPVVTAPPVEVPSITEGLLSTPQEVAADAAEIQSLLSRYPAPVEVPVPIVTAPPVETPVPSITEGLLSTPQEVAADQAEIQNLLNRYPALVAPPAPVVTAPIVEAPVPVVTAPPVEVPSITEGLLSTPQEVAADAAEIQSLLSRYPAPVEVPVPIVTAPPVETPAPAITEGLLSTPPDVSPEAVAEANARIAQAEAQAAARAQAEAVAEANARIAQAEAQAAARAQAEAVAEANARIAQQEAQAQARAQAEAVAEANARIAQQEAQSQARAQAEAVAEANARIAQAEAQAAARAQAEAVAEANARIAQQEAQAQARAQAEAEAAARAQAEAAARAQAEAQAQARAQAEAEAARMVNVTETYQGDDPNPPGGWTRVSLPGKDNFAHIRTVSVRADSAAAAAAAARSGGGGGGGYYGDATPGGSFGFVQAPGERGPGGARGSSGAATGGNNGDASGGGDRGTRGGFAKGGYVSMQHLGGPNPKGSDDGYAALKMGEFVINDKAVKKYGIELMNLINSGKIKKGKLLGLLEM